MKIKTETFTTLVMDEKRAAGLETILSSSEVQPEATMFHETLDSPEDPCEGLRVTREIMTHIVLNEEEVTICVNGLQDLLRDLQISFSPAFFQLCMKLVDGLIGVDPVENEAGEEAEPENDREGAE